MPPGGLPAGQRLGDELRFTGAFGEGLTLGRVLTDPPVLVLVGAMMASSIVFQSVHYIKHGCQVPTSLVFMGWRIIAEGVNHQRFGLIRNYELQ